ncbi:transcription factor bHLH162-like protein [Tanacetum coccineum]
MKGLCYKLNSLVPSLFSQPFKLTTQENQFDHSTVYIKQLQKRIELLKEKREEALRRKNDALCSIENNRKAAGSWLPTVEVKEFEGALQVFLTCNPEREFSLSQVFRIVEDGGGEVVKGGYTIVGDKVIYTIHAKVFGPDKRERPAGKQRAGKKQKSVETSGSTGGSQSESVSSLVSQDYRRKCDAAERAYEAQREKDLAIKKCEEMRFLMIDTSNLPPHKRAFIERQQAEIMRKYQDAGADDAGADD